MILDEQSMNPNFEPLENLAEIDKRLDLNDWMWMGSYLVRLKGVKVTVQTYKHQNTRRYLNIDGNGNLYYYAPGEGYTPITGTIEHAVTHAISIS